MKNDTAPPSGSPAGRGDDSARKLVHDLRNAIAPIRNAVQLLRMRGKADDELAPVIDIIERQADQIVRLLKAHVDGDREAHRDPASTPGREREPPSATAAGRRILIVDDNAAFLTSLSSVLAEAGHAVMTAGDGEKALEVAQSWQPEFILLDVHMPRMNGFEAAKQLRAKFPQGDVKLILLSGSTLDETTLRAAERAGFDHCLDKVHDFSALEKLLRGGT